MFWQLPARAETPVEEAQVLFESARALMLQGNFAEACAKLERSETLDPGIGTRFNLARCYELSGRLASAHAAYERVVAETHAAGQASREEVARDLATKLEARVAHVKLIVDADVATPGLELSLDGALVADHSARLPVDPGTHLVTAFAPGAKPWRAEFSIDHDAQSEIVVIPKLAHVPVLGPTSEVPPAPVVATHDSSSGRGRAMRIAGITLGALGLGGLGVGAYYGGEAWSLESQANAHCSGTGCGATGYALREQSRSDGNVATASLTVGAVLLVTGVVLWLVAPPDSAASSRHLASFHNAEYGPASAVP